MSEWVIHSFIIHSLTHSLTHETHREEEEMLQSARHLFHPSQLLSFLPLLLIGLPWSENFGMRARGSSEASFRVGLISQKRKSSRIGRAPFQEKTAWLCRIRQQIYRNTGLRGSGLAFLESEEALLSRRVISGWNFVHSMKLSFITELNKYRNKEIFYISYPELAGSSFTGEIWFESISSLTAPANWEFPCSL